MDRHPYRGCGLDYVYLANGHEVRETVYGRGVAVEDADDLHEAIARFVVTSPFRMRGQELRYLRSMLDLSQGAVARLLGVTRVSVARWEQHPHRPLPGAADRLLRLNYAGKSDGLGSPMAKRVFEMFEDIDGVGPGRVIFEHRQRWQRAA